MAQDIGQSLWAEQLAVFLSAGSQGKLQGRLQGEGLVIGGGASLQGRS